LRWRTPRDRPRHRRSLHNRWRGDGSHKRIAYAARRPRASAKIEGGQSRRVTKGDVIVIPARTPHWYKEVEGSVTYLEVRFDVDLKK
jgi:hypothetical protein